MPTTRRVMRVSRVLAIAFSARSSRSGASQGTHTTRGSLRNQPSWRRENRRVAVIVASIAWSRVVSPARYAATSR